MPSSQGWFVWAACAAVFAALTAIFAKVGIQGVNSNLATLVRTVIIVFVLAAFVLLTNQWSNPFTLSRKTWIFLTLSALATGASWVCYFRALQIGDASKVAPVDKMSLVFVAIFATIFLGERPAFREWLGILMVASGVVVLALPSRVAKPVEATTVSSSLTDDADNSPDDDQLSDEAAELAEDSNSPDTTQP